MPKLLAIDTNMLLLLVVGLASEAASKPYLEKHKRTQVYNKELFELLQLIISQSSGLLLTPNVLSETSNLMYYISDKQAKNDIAISFKSIVDMTSERFIKSTVATSNANFVFLGLADAVLLEIQTKGIILLTDDFPLYQASVNLGYEVINFSHVREEFDL
ncbi:hypothetical protein [Methylobacterium sp. WCS2018Hpa-22]|uniref:hypothetical protein n=1 Tax=Methylobacterium sp. WCS2018Hpa-22 TaxID=3073633 RepID=UPI00288A5639|nr:hypothetical protein [Methylobacterium sp. WCS2018Hpa-22]